MLGPPGRLILWTVLAALTSKEISRAGQGTLIEQPMATAEEEKWLYFKEDRKEPGAELVFMRVVRKCPSAL